MQDGISWTRSPWGQGSTPTGLGILGVNKRSQVDQGLQMDLGSWCCALWAGSDQASPGANQEDGTAEESRRPAAAELSLEGGGRGREGEGVGRHIPQAFWPLTGTGGQRKGEEQVRTPG